MAEIARDALYPALDLPPISRVVLGLAHLVLVWEMRRTTRKALQQLEPHLLRDIGLTSDQAAREAGKPAWIG
jgi:uncharacterized protein YjiS (DUF1127 family)